MSSKSFIIIFLVLVSAFFLKAEKIVILPELTDPHDIIVEGNEIFIEDFPKIYVFAAEDLKLKMTLGKQGEGPGEFLKRSGYVRLNIAVRKDFIFVESHGRLTFFSRQGDYIRQLNSAGCGYLFKPLSSGKLVGHKDIIEANTRFKTLNIFSGENLKLEKRFYRLKHGIQPGRVIVVFDKVLRSYSDGRFIYVVAGFDFIIDVFDLEGNPAFKIQKKDYIPLKITRKDKNETHAYLKVALSNYPLIKDRLRFPENFLAVRQVVPDDGLLYVTTYCRTEKGLECFVFDRHGEFRKKNFLPVIRDNVLREYPYDIHGGFIYQLVESDSGDTWALHIREMN